MFATLMRAFEKRVVTSGAGEDDGLEAAAGGAAGTIGGGAHGAAAAAVGNREGSLTRPQHVLNTSSTSPKKRGDTN